MAGNYVKLGTEKWPEYINLDHVCRVAFISEEVSSHPAVAPLYRDYANVYMSDGSGVVKVTDKLGLAALRYALDQLSRDLSIPGKVK